MARPEEIYKIYRDYIEHEDELIYHRTIAFITIQSFLIITFGYSLQKKYEIAEKLFNESPSHLPLAALGSITTDYNWFLFILALVGVITSGCAWLSIRAARNAILELRRGWLDFSKQQPSPHLPGITGGGSDKATNDGIRLSTLTPFFFVCLWLLVMFTIIIVLNVSSR